MLAILPIADVAATLTLQDRTEVRGRTPVDTRPGASAALDVETAPEARLTLRSHRLQAAITLAPRLTFWDVVETGAPPVLLGAGSVRGEWRAPRSRVWLEESLSYGQMSLASSPATPAADGSPPRVDALPTTRVITLASSRSTLGSRSDLGRFALGALVGYQVAGGADASARTVLPRQAGPFAEASGEYTIDRRNRADTILSASEASFSSGPEALVVELDQAWRHRLRRTTELRLALGVSEARVRTGALSPHTTETHPVAEAGLTDRSRTGDGTLDVRCVLRLGPTVNQVVGLVDERVSGTLAASTTTGRLGAHVFASAGQSVPASGVDAVQIASGEVGGSWDVSTRLALDTGLRAVGQRQIFTRDTFLQWTVFAGVTLRMPPEHL